MEDLITYSHVLFQQSGTNSPPLPPAPLHESAAPATYGSTYTKTTTMPPPPVPTSPRGHRKAASTSGTPRSSFDVQRPNLQDLTPQLPPRVTPQDFTPQLPPRPTNSIHPSLRAGPHASSPARQAPSIRSGQFFDDQLRVTPSGSLSATYEGSVNTSSSSLPQPHSPQERESPPPSGPSPGTSPTAAEPPSRQASTKGPSEQAGSPRAPESDGPSSPPRPQPDAFTPPQPPTSARTGSHESGLELSSTASAAAFASASASAASSPPSSAPSSGQSSPSKRSTHGRKPSSQND